MHSDATDVRQLTTDGLQPEVSRDGSQIAFIRGVPGVAFRTHIWVMNADGSNLHEVYVPRQSDCGCTLPPSRGRAGP